MEKPPIRAIRQVVYVPTTGEFIINPSNWTSTTPGFLPLNVNQVSAWYTIPNVQAQSCGFYVNQAHATIPVGIKVGVGQQLVPGSGQINPAGEFNLFNLKFTTWQLRARQAQGATVVANQGNGLEGQQFVPLELLDNWERSANILTKFAQRTYFVPLGPVSGLAGSVWPQLFYSEILQAAGAPGLLKGIFLLNVEIQ